jgi:NAD(P)-dependent dehydrogenase (short-subunit alcohol dehydrogenase family)
VPRFEPHPERRACIVTGASSGIGQATALLLAGAGHPVVIGARRLERLAQTVSEIEARGGEAHAIRLDLADPASIEAFVKAALEAVGDVDVLVCAAGRSTPDSVLDPSPDEFAATVAVNLLGAHRLVALLVPSMVERRRGDLVFVTSEVVRFPRVRTSAYVSSKWGLEGYARTLQMELEGTGVRASIVQPGQTLTEMGSDWDPEVTTDILGEWIRWGAARHHHFMHPDAVAGAVHSVVAAPPGTHLTLVEVQPVAPVRREPPPDQGTTSEKGGT